MTNITSDTAHYTTLPHAALQDENTTHGSSADMATTKLYESSYTGAGSCHHQRGSHGVDYDRSCFAILLSLEIS